MTFGEAITAMKDGHKVSRAGWNGKGMFIVLMPGLRLPAASSAGNGPKVNQRTARHIGQDTPLDSQPYFAMRTASGQWQPGWTCSTPDALADDWGLA